MCQALSQVLGRDGEKIMMQSVSTRQQKYSGGAKRGTRGRRLALARCGEGGDSE